MGEVAAVGVGLGALPDEEGGVKRRVGAGDAERVPHRPRPAGQQPRRGMQQLDVDRPSAVAVHDQHVGRAGGEGALDSTPPRRPCQVPPAPRCRSRWLFAGCTRCFRSDNVTAFTVDR